MAEAALELKRISKTYIVGSRKNAAKAQKAIKKLHKKYEEECENDPVCKTIQGKSWKKLKTFSHKKNMKRRTRP